MNQSQFFWGGGGAASYSIDRSLRFNDGDDVSLSRTFSTSTNHRKSTVSFWVKRGSVGTSVGTVFQGGIDSATSAGNVAGFRFRADDAISIYDYQSGYALYLITTPVFRDPTAWYHIVFAIDTTQSTPANRNKLYVNGEQITSFSTQTNYGSNDNPKFNSSNNTHVIGQWLDVNNQNLYYFDGYLTEFNFVDGQQLTRS